MTRCRDSDSESESQADSGSEPPACHPGDSEPARISSSRLDWGVLNYHKWQMATLFTSNVKPSKVGTLKTVTVGLQPERSSVQPTVVPFSRATLESLILARCSLSRVSLSRPGPAGCPGQCPAVRRASTRRLCNLVSSSCTTSL